MARRAGRLESRVDPTLTTGITMTTFKKAVSWAYHGETEEEIRNDLGYVGDLTPVYEVAYLLKTLGADHDTVNAWSTAPDAQRCEGKTLNYDNTALKR